MLAPPLDANTFPLDMTGSSMSAPIRQHQRPGVAGASSGDALDSIRAEDADPSYTLVRLCDEDTSKALLHRTVGLNIRDFTWSHAVQQIAAGITVTLDCGSIPAKRFRHRLRLHPDGTITLLDHTVADSSGEAHGQHSDALDLDALTALHTMHAADAEADAALQTMRALGAEVPDCAKVALWLTGTQADPASPLADAGETFGVATGWMARYRFAALRNLYTAVAWAQHPFWPRGAGQRFLNHGITPTILRRWADAGWTVHDAITWLSEGATLPAAEQWRAAGMTDRRAARLAAVGELPDSEDPWLEAGFAPGESDQWRARKEYGQIPRLDPDEAYYWHRHGVRPNSVRDFKALAIDETGAGGQTHPRPGLASMKNTDAATRGGARPTRQRALEWTAAGVPSDLVLAWCTTIGTDDTALALTLEWHPTVPAGQFPSIANWNNTHPHATLQPDDVARLRRLGIAADAETMSRAAAHSSEALLRPVQMLVAGKRWYGRDLRRALTDAAAEAARTPSSGPWKPLSTMPQTILDGGWERVERSLRSIWDGDNTATWRVVLDWLDTKPTPPAPYRNAPNQS